MISKKYTFKSEKSGPSVLILGSIYNDEQTPTKAVYMVLEKFASKSLTPLKGSVSFIPVCEQNCKQQLDSELIEHISNADIILDLRSATISASQPFILVGHSDETTKKISSALNIKYLVKHSLPTDSLTKSYLVINCGEDNSDQTLQTAYYSILSALLCLDMLQGYPSQPVKQTFININKVYTKSKGGTLAQSFNSFDKVSKGETLVNYIDGTCEICQNDAYIILPQTDNEWFYLGTAADNF